MTNREQASPDDDVLSRIGIDADNPNSARRYNYWLGGKDNFKADRASAKAIEDVFPHAPINARENRSFLQRAVRYLVEEYGIRQFLDIGAGLPTAPNLHEVAQEVAPETRVLYVDNDPIVLLQARELLTSAPEGHTAYLDADLHEPGTIIRSEQFIETFDLSAPIAVTLMAVLQFVVDEDEAHHIIDTLLAPLPSGSVLALSTVTADSAPDEVTKGVAAYNARGIKEKARDLDEVRELFTGLDLIDPGVVLVNHWKPDAAALALADGHVHMYGGIARKP
jgi:hypothetical protein